MTSRAEEPAAAEPECEDVSYIYTLHPDAREVWLSGGRVVDRPFLIRSGFVELAEAIFGPEGFLE